MADLALLWDWPASLQTQTNQIYSMLRGYWIKLQNPSSKLMENDIPDKLILCSFNDSMQNILTSDAYSFSLSRFLSMFFAILSKILFAYFASLSLHCVTTLLCKMWSEPNFVIVLHQVKKWTKHKILSKNVK